MPLRVGATYHRRMDVTLAHGTGNDFVVLPDLDDAIELSSGLARALCDRRRGPGGDGVLRLGASRTDDADVFMDHRNADGSTARMCGNGVRVVAKHLLDHGLLDPRRRGDRPDVVRVATRSGVKDVTVVERHGDGTVAAVAVDMGRPRFAPRDVPFDAVDPDATVHAVPVDDPAVAVALGKDVVEFAVVSMGNPHAVLLVGDAAGAAVDTIGRWLETHPRFPEHANIGFAQVVGRGALHLRVWERGVGETAACGTGACAAVVALQRQGLVDRDVAVTLPGGTLQVAHVPGRTVTMVGPAVEIAHGRLDPAWLDAVRHAESEGTTP